MRGRLRLGIVSLACAISLALAPRGLAQSEAGGAPAFSIDHVGCAVDQATFDAVTSSSFLREELAHSRPGGARTADGASWTNFIIFGELTYLEFLPPADAQRLGLEVGVCFVALHSDQADAVEWLSGEMSRRHPESRPRVGLREMVRGEARIPWYHSVVFDYEAGPAGFGVWAKVYHREFKHRMIPEFEIGDITRSRGGAPFAFHRQKLLQDVVRLRIAVTEARREQIENLFSVMALARSERGAASAWRGDDFEIEVVTASPPRDFALTSVGLRLTRPGGQPAVQELGPSLRLRLPGDASAVFELGPE